MHKRHGFTLVELIVVIAVIGVLAAIVVLGLTRYQADTRDARRASSAAAISEALEKYYDQNGEYPSCTALSGSGSTVANETLGGITAGALIAPQATTGTTNSIDCATLSVNGTDFFEYDGDGSASCNTDGSCLQYTLKYKEEATGTIKSLASRRTTAIATSGAPVLTISNTDFDNVSLSWAAIPNATSYKVQRSTASDFSANVADQTFTDTTGTMTGLSINTHYYFRALALNGTSESAWSTSVDTTTPSIGAPSTITCVADSNSQISVSWGAGPNAATYTFQYSTNSDYSSPVQTTGISTTSKVLTGLSTGVTYYIRVKSVNSPYESSWKNCSATTFVPAPSCATATATGSTTMDFTWCTVSVATSYVVEYDDDSDFSTPITDFYVPGASSSSLSIDDAPQGATVYVRVFAYVGTTASNPSPTASDTTTVDTPSKPSVTAYRPGATRSCSASGWIIGCSSGSYYYAYGKVTSSTCPSGTTKYFYWRARYNSPTTEYAYGPSTTSTVYGVQPVSGYNIQFEARLRCRGPAGVYSSYSSYDASCVSSSQSTGSNCSTF